MIWSGSLFSKTIVIGSGSLFSKTIVIVSGSILRGPSVSLVSKMIYSNDHYNGNGVVQTTLYSIVNIITKHMFYM